MSIMDHDPKYAKLREWRQTTYRDWIVGEYERSIRLCMLPPAPLRRQMEQIAQEEPGKLFICRYPCRDLLVRISIDCPVYPWKPITALAKQLVEGT